MSEHSLPEDLSRWPDNPYELLGVTRNVCLRDLRRAYTRLIRAYKPEQYPEHFCRIRQAYETVLRYAELFGLGDGTPTSEPETLNAPQGDSDSPFQETPSAKIPPPQVRSLEEMLEELWDKALTGQEVEAYQSLRQMNQQHAGKTAILIQLYWLLEVMPELDPGRSPSDWLAEGLQSCGLMGPLRELYRREIVGWPQEALTERFGRLLNCPVRAGQLADWIEWRWKPAARLGRWDVLKEDLAVFRERILREEETTWLRLLFGLVDELAWTDHPDGAALYQACCEEIDRHHHLAHGLSFYYDRLDLLRETSSGWLSLCRRIPLPGDLPGDLLRLIPQSWTRPFAEVRPLLQAVLDQLCQAPLEWLGYLDQFEKLAPGALAQFGRLLDQLGQGMGGGFCETRYSDQVVRLVQEFLDSVGITSYKNYRTQLLAFCIREAITPEQVAAAAGEQPANWSTRGNLLSNVLAIDWPIQYVSKGYRLFWA